MMSVRKGLLLLIIFIGSSLLFSLTVWVNKSRMGSSFGSLGVLHKISSSSFKEFFTIGSFTTSSDPNSVELLCDNISSKKHNLIEH